MHPYGAGRQPAYVADCAQIDGGCSNGVFFAEYRAASAAITVITATATVSGTIALVYTVSYPNGRECEPRLERASVVVDARNGFVVNG